jgi:protein TonB
VLGGQLLGENVVQEESAASTGSKKGLFLAIAATALLSIGGGAWYYQKYYSRTTAVAPARPASVSSSAAPTHVSELPPARNDSTAGINMANPALPTASAALSKSSKNPEPVASQAVFKPAPESKNAEPNPRTAPPAEPQRKPSLGDVHLATPVVNRGTASPQAAVALPSLQIDASPAGSDPLAAVESIQHKELVAPRPVGGDVKTAQLLKSVAPVYPPLARAQRISGNVQIDALIDASGNVATVKVISGPPVLHNSALEAVKQWKYSPALLDGQPTSMHLTVVVQFRTQ